MKKISANEIKHELDGWVSSVGSGRYVPSNYSENLNESFSITENEVDDAIEFCKKAA